MLSSSFVLVRAAVAANTLSRAATILATKHTAITPTWTRKEERSAARFLHTTRPRGQKEEESAIKEGEEKEGEFSTDPKDRTRVIPFELSVKYMESGAYAATYGNHKVWELYRRNIAKGKTQKPPRKKCIRHGRLATNNPCPICRDEYLVVDYRNTKLLNQFLTDYNAQMLDSLTTGVCREQHFNLTVALEKAKDHGLLNVDPPFVEYDYDKYRPEDMEEEGKSQ